MNDELVFYFIHYHTGLPYIESIRTSSTGRAIAQYRTDLLDPNRPYTTIRPFLLDPYPNKATIITFFSASHDFPSNYRFLSLEQLLYPLYVTKIIKQWSIHNIGAYLKLVNPFTDKEFSMTEWIANCYFAYIKKVHRSITVAEITTDAFNDVVEWGIALFK